jgi:Lar family restriction alleviation protein
MKVTNNRFKACPFCGGNDIAVIQNITGRKLHYVMCCNCGVSIDDCDDEEKAVEVWNRRAVDGEQREEKENKEWFELVANVFQVLENHGVIAEKGMSVPIRLNAILTFYDKFWEEQDDD